MTDSVGDISCHQKTQSALQSEQDDPGSQQFPDAAVEAGLRPPDR